MKAAILVLLVACAKEKEAPKPAPPPGPAVASGSGSASATPSMVDSSDPGFAAYEAKDYKKCVELYAKVDKPDARYNAACCLALDGKRDEAFAMLDRVLADNFRDVEHLKKDTDLASLHADPRWPKLVAAVEANVAKYEASIKEPALRKELLALRDEDQAARQAAIANPKDTAAAERMRAIDTKATARMKEIIAEARNVWPGKSLVGDDGANAAWLLVQHADHDPAFQKQALALLEQAYKAGEAREVDYAYLFDRVAVAEGKPQRYGTQFKDGRPQPIEDEARVDERRKAIGLPTMAEYVKQMQQMYGTPFSSTTK